MCRFIFFLNQRRQNRPLIQKITLKLTLNLQILTQFQNSLIQVINRYFLMGTCTSDPLGSLSDTYGEDVCKYIVSVKSQEFLEQVTPRVAKKVQQQFTFCSKSLQRQFDSKQQTIKDYYDDVLKRVLKDSRVALQGVKKRQKKNQEEIFGLTQIQQRFVKLKADKDQKIRQYRSSILSILEQKKLELKQENLLRRPELPLLQEMPFWLRDQALLDAEIRYDHEINMRKQELENILERSIQMVNLEEILKKTVGLQEANELVKAAQKSFQRIKRNLTFSDNPRSCFI